MKKKILILAIIMAVFVGCTPSETTQSTEQTSLEVNQEYIDDLINVLNNTISYETIEAKVTTTALDEVSTSGAGAMMFSKNPNMGLIMQTQEGEEVPTNLYIDNDGEDIIMSIGYSPSAETGELESILQETVANQLYTMDMGFTDSQLTLENNIHILKTAENIKSIEKTETGYVYELSQKFFDDLLEIQVAQSTENLETVPEEARAQFELMIEIMKSQENQMVKVEVVLEDSRLVKLISESSMSMATLNFDGTLSEEKIQTSVRAEMEIVRFNDNENIRNEIWEVYNKTAE